MVSNEQILLSFIKDSFEKQNMMDSLHFPNVDVRKMLLESLEFSKIQHGEH